MQAEKEPQQTQRESYFPEKNPYWMENWGDGYFGMNEEGHLLVCPKKDGEWIDLYTLVRSLVQRGIDPPILFRFNGIIQNRIQRIYDSFAAAIDEYQYGNTYQLAFPIKVNQQKHLIDTIRKGDGRNFVSLEVGSKPELIAVLSAHDSEQALLLCNGYKDAQYIELALLARKIGTRSIIIIEQFYELELVLDLAAKLHIEPEIGIRLKPSTKGSGKWASSGGELAKFGLSIEEIYRVIKHLKDCGKDKYLKLLHFHIGSQLTSIISLKKALREAARIYTEIAKQCPSLSFFDAGGGLAVDYEGSKTQSDCSMNYTIEQYARDVVYAVHTFCKEEAISPPVLITESGRAVVAHHSILVTEAIDVSEGTASAQNLTSPPTHHPILKEMFEIYHALEESNCLESLHDATDLKERAGSQFIQGHLTLEEKAYSEHIFRHLSAKVLELGRKMEIVPKEIQELDHKLLDLYFCNFSVFQSLPDSWAIQQLFPIMPIHRLNEIPTRKGTIVDLTCDSDGTVSRFVHPRKTTKWIPLHPLESATPYYLGIFLVGAYQETLGNLHNLFGDTNAVHVDQDEQKNWIIEHLIEGDSIKKVLNYVQFNTDQLSENLRHAIDKALRANQLTFDESALIKSKFKQALESYTYLVV